ncbi:uncharacterized protein [Gossypium hirsutum]|uniref:Uncharacterized protein isoform X2 n=1 Tax=Gossypium hirsutum TaxID=3635 RepID=A0ABM3AHJ1_GOSHI|nr:uncharacterized protein LOC107887038 isoform X2 [Gossypium hirsutum]
MCLRRKRRGDTGVKNLLGCQDFSPHISYYQPRRRSRRLLVKRRIKINSHSCSLVILFRSLVCFQDYPKSATKETTLLDGPLTKHPASPETGEEPTVRRCVIHRAGHRTRWPKITLGAQLGRRWGGAAGVGGWDRGQRLNGSFIPVYCGSSLYSAPLQLRRNKTCDL